MTRWRPYLAGERSSYTYYPDSAEVGLGAAAELRGQSFTVLADVTVDGADAHGVLFKQGGAHGGHVLFIADGRLRYVYNFLGEQEQSLVSPDPIPLGRHIFGVQYERTGTVEGSHTPLGTPPCTSTTTRSPSWPGCKPTPACSRSPGWHLRRP